MQDTITPEPDPVDRYLQTLRKQVAAATGIPVEAITPTEGSNPHDVASAERASMQHALDIIAPDPGIACQNCGRERTLADDYDYNPLQLVTGRRLGWFSGDGEQVCGECLAAMMRGQTP
jgi:hypothetical protein